MSASVNKQGGFGSLLTIAYRNIWRNLRRTILCFTAVAIAVFFSIVMQSMIEGMLEGIEEAVQTFDTGHVNVVSREFEEEKEYYPVQYPLANGRNAGEIVAGVENIPGVKAAFPRITAYATLSDSVVKHARLWGIDIEKENAVNNFNLSERNNGLVQGRFPEQGENECMIGTRFAEKAGLTIGDGIPLKVVSAQFSDKYWTPRVTGIFEYDYVIYDEETIIVQFDRLQKLLVLEGGTQQLFIYGDDAGKSGIIAKEAKAMLGDDVIVRQWQDNYWISMMQQSNTIFVVIYLVFQIVASFLIVNTVIMVIHERIKEIGMMGSLGMTRREIVEVFFFEAIFLSVIGSLIGCVVGGLVTFALSLFPIDFQVFTGGGLKEFPMSGTLYMHFSFAGIFKGFLFGVIISSICTLIPSLKSAFIEPVEALRR